MSLRKALEGLDPAYFQHPLDKAATESLKMVPGLNALTKKFMELGFEKIFLIQKIGSCLRVGPNQIPSMYNIFHDACRVLDISEPQFFIENDPVPNAYTYGYTNPFVVVTTGLIKDFTEDELMFIIGHELGHVKCGHTLYNTMTSNITILIGLLSDITLGLGNLVTIGIQLALLEWSRKAEFSADRAGMLAVQNVDSSYNALSKLLAPVKELWREVNQRDIILQAEEFEGLSEEDNLNKIYKFLSTVQLSHPWTILRTKEVINWAEVGDYQKILDMDMLDFTEYYVSKEEKPATPVCPDCGTQLTWIDQYQRWYCYGCSKYP